MRIDIHQHLWTEPLVWALSRREELPFVRQEQGLTVLYLKGERPYVIDLAAESVSSRAALVDKDGLDRALVCLSHPLGIDALPREEALGLIDAYHQGALALGEPFGVWGAVALDGLDGDDVDHALDLGCAGISLPAGAFSSLEGLARLGPVLARLERREAPVLIHPGPGIAGKADEVSLGDPLWWPALTRYVAEMHAAWLAFASVGRRSHPELRVIYTMLAGLAPLHAERLISRGGPTSDELDPLIFYDTSSYGQRAIGKLEGVVDAGQILYGSDRPVVDPGTSSTPSDLEWSLLEDCSRRAFDGSHAKVAVSQ
jgi:hypothetical protein